MNDRAQSNVVGVALLLGITAIAMAALTAGVGTVVESGATGADVTRVTHGLETAFRPVETTGTSEGTVSFSEGSLVTVERELRVLDADGVRFERRVDGLAYRPEGGPPRVVALGGAVVRDHSGGARFARRPPIAVAGSGDAATLVVGVVDVDGDVSVAASGRARVRLRTHVEHDRVRLGHGEFRVAVETATPGPWREFFERRGANVERRDLDDDGVESVVAAFGDRTAYLAVHDVEVDASA